MSHSTVSYLWREPHAAQGFKTGVSLHSHTSHSRETLDFIAELSTEYAVLQPLIRWGERRCFRASGIRPDYARSFWTPPLTPRLAFDLERGQIENGLQLAGLVSLTDHDCISAPQQLRALPAARNIPMSVEWTVPYGNPSTTAGGRPTAFHLGIHNLPAAAAPEWMERLHQFTTQPLEQRPVRQLRKLLSGLDELPGVLIVFNHPLWDLYRIGADAHQVLVNDFLAAYGQHVHALELNGLRSWTENRAVRDLGRRWNQLVISGGDRHGTEPNANLNVTRAGSFDEFVHEVRRERVSHVLFMPQYRQPCKFRILVSTLDAIRTYPQHPAGSRHWDERVFAPDLSGQPRPLSALWGGGSCSGNAPIYLSAVLGAVRLLGRRPVAEGLRLAWDESREADAAMREQM